MGPPSRFLLLVPLLCAIYRLYAIAFGADTGFDDDANLRALAAVHDFESAARFVLSGGAGPLGRPLALASFLIDAPAWPSEPAALLRTNALIHLLNVTLVAWLALRLSELLPSPPARPEVFALAVAGFWGTAPVLMSASLLAVQRMTTLSATFSLLGLIVWLAARRQLHERPWRALCLMTLAVGTGTALAALSKEIGALLPLLVAVVEATLAGPKWPTPEAARVRRAWLAWRVVVFGAPVLLLIGLTWLHLRDVAGAYQGRGYGPLDRLMMESGILFEYLRHLLVPRCAGLGPFHDDVVVRAGGMQLLALLAWMLLCVIAWRLRHGPWRIAGLALGWYLGGHLLESTIFPLEPYFEHRSYLPAVGIAFGLCAALWEWPGRLRVAGRVLLLGLGFNAVFTSWQLATIWADPLLSGPIWSQEHPLSMRALMYYSRKTAELGNVPAGVALFDAAAPGLQRQPDYIAARLQLYCGTQGRERIAVAAAGLRALPGDGIVDFDTPQSIGVAMDFAANGWCEGFDPALGLAALESILELPADRVMRRALPVAHELIARYWIRQRRLDLSMHHLEQEFALGGRPETVALMVAVLGSAGHCDGARAALRDAERMKGWNALANAGWSRSLQPAREEFREWCAGSGDAP